MPEVRNGFSPGRDDTLSCGDLPSTRYGLRRSPDLAPDFPAPAWLTGDGQNDILLMRTNVKDPSTVPKGLSGLVVIDPHRQSGGYYLSSLAGLSKSVPSPCAAFPRGSY